MPVEPLDTLKPSVHPSAFVHPSAWVIADVQIDRESSIWPMSVLRGDAGRITVGARTNLQDGTIAHATTHQTTTTIGSDCTVGHRVTLHGCTVASHCLIGMGSTLLDGVVLGEWCFVAAGTLLPPGKTFPPKSFIIGNPGRCVREVEAREVEMITHGAKGYVELMLWHQRKLG